MVQTLFAFDCGATNWRLYRASYQQKGPYATIIGEPQPAPLTSFVERRLPAVLLLDPAGKEVLCFGDVAEQRLQDETDRERIRAAFKPCIGAHLLDQPLPHQKRYSHTQALDYTQQLLQAVLAQLQQEKWRASAFDQSVHFSFATPVHWGSDHDGQVLQVFQETVLACFPEALHPQVRFVPEPEGAILSLRHQGVLGRERQACLTLIVDVGGSTTDLVAGRVSPETGELETLGRYGGPHGGGLYDAELAKSLADALKMPASALADDPSALAALQAFARQMKESLSRQLLHPGDSLHGVKRSLTLVTQGGQVYRQAVTIDDARFREINRHLIVDFEYLVEEGLRAMGLEEDQIDQAILVGGGSQLYTIVGHLRSRFGRQAVTLADNPDEAVAHGVALEYGRATERAQRAQSKAAQTKLEKVSAKLQRSDGKTFSLQRGVTTLGRKRANNIWLKDNLASRFHAEIHETSGSFALIDLDSANGTFLNGERLAPHQPHLLTAGDEVRIGAASFNFVIPMADAPDSEQNG